MAGVSIRLTDVAFAAGGLLEGQPVHKARYVMQAGGFGPPHIAHSAWFNGRNAHENVPNSVSIVLQGKSPSWFETAEEFNLLPYITIRDQIANEVERGVMLVIASTGATATATQIRNGTVP